LGIGNQHQHRLVSRPCCFFFGIHLLVFGSLSFRSSTSRAVLAPRSVRSAVSFSGRSARAPVCSLR
jgi:hypothetical protein